MTDQKKICSPKNAIGENQQSPEPKENPGVKEDALTSPVQEKVRKHSAKAENGFAEREMFAAWEKQQRELLKNEWAELEKAQMAFEKRKSNESILLAQKLDALWREQSAKQQSELDEIRDRRLDEINKRCEEETEKLLRRAEDNARASNSKFMETLAHNQKLLEEEFDHIKRKQSEYLARERDEAEAERQKISLQRQALRDEKEKLEKDRGELDAQRMRLDVLRNAMEAQKRNMDQTASELAEGKVSEIRARMDSVKEALDRANGENRQLQARVTAFETLNNRLGGREPEALLHELEDKRLALEALRRDLQERPPRELKSRYDELAAREREWRNLRGEYESELEKMKGDVERVAMLEAQLVRTRRERDGLKQQFELLQIENKKLSDDLGRLKSQYGKGAELEERIKAVEVPYEPDPVPIGYDPANEIAWLDRIEESCREYNFKFPRRILEAFHTALKVAELSPITVLAGVSGTGKSELPRLYSLFGGINFMSLPVQPNWDSQESMLGFFNTIDNVFDAQPVLRFLAQSQKDRTSQYPGMKEAVNMVLLDEMNLAHIELYFAEFLSKLETRRGKSANDLPKIDVKLGADIAQPYRIDMGRNILFVGTMNQDETTKSLSDKVLDRSSVINFPRPLELNRRPSAKKTFPKKPELLLPYDTWHKKWKVLDTTFADEDIAPYKNFVQEINVALENVGRALGHRVWQSIEAYMANHPRVKASRENQAGSDEIRANMRIAFEDSLVQKVMPKLRGIETRGDAKKKCLDVIGKMLLDNGYSLVEDFKLASSPSLGQFIWNSARYLDEGM